MDPALQDIRWYVPGGNGQMHTVSPDDIFPADNTTWIVAFNQTRGMYAILRKGSPPIAFCMDAADADTICNLLNGHHAL